MRKIIYTYDCLYKNVTKTILNEEKENEELFFIIELRLKEIRNFLFWIYFHIKRYILSKPIKNYIFSIFKLLRQSHLKF
jgi:hypothetical protein